MDAMQTAALLQIDALRHVYPSGDAPDRVILDDVGFTLRTHEIVALLGRSGCGKSTLLRIIAGLMSPSAGAVRIDGHPADKGIGNAGGVEPSGDPAHCFVDAIVALKEHVDVPKPLAKVSSLIRGGVGSGRRCYLL